MPNVECRMKRGEWERESGKNQSHLRTQPSAHAELRQKYEREPLNPRHTFAAMLVLAAVE